MVKRFNCQPLTRGDVGFNVAPITVLQVHSCEGEGDLLVILDIIKHGLPAINAHKAILRGWHFNEKRDVELVESRFMEASEAKEWCEIQVEAFGGYVLNNPGLDTWWPTRERFVTSRRGAGAQYMKVSASKPQKNKIAAAHPFEPADDMSVVSVECVHKQSNV